MFMDDFSYHVNKFFITKLSYYNTPKSIHVFFSFQTKQILERHLVISDRAYTMADIKHLTNDTLGVLLPTLRDSLRLRIRESDNS